MKIRSFERPGGGPRTVVDYDGEHLAVTSTTTDRHGMAIGCTQRYNRRMIELYSRSNLPPCTVRHEQPPSRYGIPASTHDLAAALMMMRASLATEVVRTYTNAEALGAIIEHLTSTIHELVPELTADKEATHA